MELGEALAKMGKHCSQFRIRVTSWINIHSDIRALPRKRNPARKLRGEFEGYHYGATLQRPPVPYDFFNIATDVLPAEVMLAWKAVGDRIIVGVRTSSTKRTNIRSRRACQQAAVEGDSRLPPVSWPSRSNALHSRRRQCHLGHCGHNAAVKPTPS